MSMTQPSSGPLSRERERARVRARELRETSTDAERLLWRHLRDRRLAGVRFRRQHPIGLYFADFACDELKLVIELDGGQHFAVDAAKADAKRTAVMQAMLEQTDDVLAAIHQWLQSKHPHPNPLPQAGEGDRQDTSP